MAYNREKLISLIRRDALEFGDFLLASGRRSSFYLDCRKVTLSAEGAVEVAAGILDQLGDLPFDAIGGLSLGADPIVGAVLHLAGERGKLLRGFLVRKEAKAHGAGRRIEGPLRHNDRVVIVDDVATTGGSCFDAADAVMALGCKVVKVLVILDRLAGAQEAARERGLVLESLLTIADLGIEPLAS